MQVEKTIMVSLLFYSWKELTHVQFNINQIFDQLSILEENGILVRIQKQDGKEKTELPTIRYNAKSGYSILISDGSDDELIFSIALSLQIITKQIPLDEYSKFSSIDELSNLYPEIQE